MTCIKEGKSKEDEKREIMEAADFQEKEIESGIKNHYVSGKPVTLYTPLMTSGLIKELKKRLQKKGWGVCYIQDSVLGCGQLELYPWGKWNIRTLLHHFFS